MGFKMRENIVVEASVPSGQSRQRSPLSIVLIDPPISDSRDYLDLYAIRRIVRIVHEGQKQKKECNSHGDK